MTRVLVLGGSGMLGSTVAAWLAADPGLEVHAAARGPLLAVLRERLPAARWFAFDAERDPCAALPEVAWVVNAAGIIKHHMLGAEPALLARAIELNALFPFRLAAWAGASGARVIQIATDCVFEGARGGWLETDPHDPRDAYGKTKSLGEVPAPGFYNVRCSVVGPELKEHRSLLDWFLRQPAGATVTGFTDHRWNGVTSLQFARLVQGLIRDHERLGLPGLQHVVPADAITKADLLEVFARCFGRRDVTIVHRPAAVAVDRTLATVEPGRNEALWRAAGYDRPPTIRAMVEELAAWRHPLRDLARPTEARA